MATDTELTDMALAVFKQETDRDRQRLVGASNISNPCNKCLAEDLLQTEREPSRFWLGGVIGTAIHALAEDRLLADPEKSVEKRVVLGHVEGYGTVKSTTDLYIKDKALVLDWKTTNRKKLELIDFVIGEGLNIDEDLYSTRQYEQYMEYVFKVRMYLNQLHLYAMGCMNEGLPVEKLALGFICRDGLTDTDIRVYSFKYQQETTDAVWNRLKVLWGYLQEGKTPDNFDGHPYCWYCKNAR